MLEARTGRPVSWTLVDEPRWGDHICYINDLTTLRANMPGWSITRSLDAIVDEMVEAELGRLHEERGAAVAEVGRA